MKTCLLLLLSLLVAGAVASAQKLDGELASMVETEYAFSRTAGEKSVAKTNPDAEKVALKNLESELSKAATERGTLSAYEAFVARDVRLYRENEFPFAGREAARGALASKPGVMAWQVAGADVARSGDLGYTYGSYEFKGKDAKGETVEKGHFMRVWQKQSDGVWKIVLDITNPLPPPAAAS